MPKYLDQFGDVVRGLLSYNPGPGIYSRLERAIQDMPANVRVQELPGLLKRYKEGVPGWELKATDLDSTIAGRDVVPRDELLAAVRERSPVYTHREVVLGGTPQTESRWAMVGSDLPVNFTGTDEEKIAAGFVRRQSPIYQRESSPLGSGVSHGGAKYEGYGQGGKDYAELLLTQRPRPDSEYGNHWYEIASPSSAVRVAAKDGAVAHARYDTHGDALRINELQSDLGIHNRKMRERAGQPQGPLGWDNTATPSIARTELPFPLEDAWAEILIKRLALEAARKGHRAIEVASPRAIADKVGGNIDNYEHFYGKVVPGALERLGRKMGGLAEDSSGVAVQSAPAGDVDAVRYAGRPEIRKTISELQSGDEYAGPGFWRLYGELIHNGLPPESRRRVWDYFGSPATSARTESEIADDIYRYFSDLGHTPEAAQKITSRALFEAPRAGKLQDNFAMQQELRSLAPLLGLTNTLPGRRYIMSDEMRRNLIEKGVGASVLAPLLLQSED